MRGYYRAEAAYHTYIVKTLPHPESRNREAPVARVRAQPGGVWAGRGPTRAGGRALAMMLVASALLAGCRPAGPEEPAPATSTLDKVASTGVITLGHRENSIPFSYFDNRQEVVGYAHQIGLAITEEVARQAGVEGLQVKLVPVTSQTACHSFWLPAAMANQPSAQRNAW